MHRSDDAGLSWTEITEGLPTEFGFAAAAHPHDRDTFYVIPLDPGHGRCMPDGSAAVWRTRDAGATWQRLDDGLPQQDAHVGVLREGMAIDSYEVPGVYFGTSTGQLFASADEGESWREIASYLPAHRVRRGRDRRLSHGRAPPAFDAAAALRGPAAPPRDRRGHRRRGDRRTSTSAGPACATGCASRGPELRRHIHVYVDRERATLDTALEPALAGRRDRRDQRRVNRTARRQTISGRSVFRASRKPRLTSSSSPSKRRSSCSIEIQRS